MHTHSREVTPQYHYREDPTNCVIAICSMTTLYCATICAQGTGYAPYIVIYGTTFMLFGSCCMACNGK